MSIVQFLMFVVISIYRSNAGPPDAGPPNDGSAGPSSAKRPRLAVGVRIYFITDIFLF